MDGMSVQGMSDERIKEARDVLVETAIACPVEVTIAMAEEVIRLRGELQESKSLADELGDELYRNFGGFVETKRDGGTLVEWEARLVSLMERAGKTGPTHHERVTVTDPLKVLTKENRTLKKYIASLENQVQRRDDFISLFDYDNQWRVYCDYCRDACQATPGG